MFRCIFKAKAGGEDTRSHLSATHAKCARESQDLRAGISASLRALARHRGPRHPARHGRRRATVVDEGGGEVQALGAALAERRQGAAAAAVAREGALVLAVPDLAPRPHGRDVRVADVDPGRAVRLRRAGRRQPREEVVHRLRQLPGVLQSCAPPRAVLASAWSTFCDICNICHTRHFSRQRESDALPVRPRRRCAGAMAPCSACSLPSPMSPPPEMRMRTRPTGKQAPPAGPAGASWPWSSAPTRPPHRTASPGS